MLKLPDDGASTGYDNNVSYVAYEVDAFFAGDIDKVMAWWFTDNPGLGNVTPASMVLFGRSLRLATFVRDARDQEGLWLTDDE